MPLPPAAALFADASCRDTEPGQARGGVVGAQIGARVGAGIKAEYVRGILGALLVAASAKFLLDLVIPPEEVYLLGGGIG